MTLIFQIEQLTLFPASGKVKFYLKFYNAETSKAGAKNLQLEAQTIPRSWNEGDGLDLEI